MLGEIVYLKKGGEKMSQHTEYYYSITIKTNDEVVLNCLKALNQYAQRSGNTRIPWSGTNRKDWERNDYCVIFHFSKPEYREIFVKEVTRLLPEKLWKKNRRKR